MNNPFVFFSVQYCCSEASNMRACEGHCLILTVLYEIHKGSTYNFCKLGWGYCLLTTCPTTEQCTGRIYINFFHNSTRRPFTGCYREQSKSLMEPFVQWSRLPIIFHTYFNGNQKTYCSLSIQQNKYCTYYSISRIKCSFNERYGTHNVTYT